MDVIGFFKLYPLWLLVTFCVVLAAWAVSLGLWLGVYLRPATKAGRLRPKAEASADAYDVSSLQTMRPACPSVTVVVYAHNQADDLLRNLPVIFQQDYPSFDVVVVDDESADETSNVLTMMYHRSEHFSHTRIGKEVRNISRRRLAMMLGVKAAQGDIVVMTQAQCVPASPRWIRSLVERFDDDVSVVFGPMAYENRAGMMAHFFCYDFAQRQMALFGLTMSVGTFAAWTGNLAFRRSVFFETENRAFRRYLSFRPGEDDLFVGAVGHARVLAMPEALVINEQSPLSTGWRRERLNRAFTSLHYRTLPVAVRGVEQALRYLVVLGLLALAACGCLHAIPEVAIFPTLWPAVASWTLFGVALALLVAYWLTVVLVGRRVSRAMGTRRYVWSPVFYGLVTPLVDLFCRTYARLHARSFRVGRLS